MLDDNADKLVGRSCEVVEVEVENMVEILGIVRVVDRPNDVEIDVCVASGIRHSSFPYWLKLIESASSEPPEILA